MKKIGWAIILGVISGSIFGVTKIYKDASLKRELKKAEVAVETIQEGRYIFTFNNQKHVLAPTVLHTVVVDFNDDAKNFILKATKEYLKHNPAPENYDKEFLQKAVFWYVHNTRADSTYLYYTPPLGEYDYRDFSSNKDTLWLNEALRGERKFTCISLSSLFAVISGTNIISISCLPDITRPPQVHILALVDDSTAIDPYDFSIGSIPDFHLEAVFQYVHNTTANNSK